MSFPWALSPRFARYYRDPNGVEFRDLMKAYGIRFDVIVNGKVCGSSHSSAWWLRGQGGWRAPGDPAVHPALLICFCLTGRKIQHHPHNHQYWFWAGAHGCCEYLPCLAGFLGRGKSLTAWEEHAEPRTQEACEVTGTRVILHPASCRRGRRLPVALAVSLSGVWHTGGSSSSHAVGCCI